jgi:putative endonuclease
LSGRSYGTGARARRAARGRRAQRVGVEAEARVAAALERDGWRVLARRWRGAGAELDLIVERDGGVLRFVEVKQRGAGDFVGLEAIGPAKVHRLRRAADAWLAMWPGPVRELALMVAWVEVLPGGGERMTFYDDAA